MSSQISTPVQGDSGPAPAVDDDRLAQALVSRGLITREEAQQCRAAGDSSEPLLSRLVRFNFLTPAQAQRVTQELKLFIGQQIPGYQLLDRLGQGAMGIVFKARQLSMNRLVAIKVLQPRLASNPRDLERFLYEAQVAAKLSHNNVVQAIDAGSAGKLHYFVMEYVEGTTITKLLEGGKVYSEREALDIMMQMAQALDHAHRRGLVHRDIKPANIIITTENVAKLADLGLAKQQSGDAFAEDDRGVIRGTPFYIAPEQIQRLEDIDIRADIYSLGATLYHMVTGQPPFSAKNIRSLFEAHLKRKLVPPDHLNTALSGGLGEMVEFMMAKDRNERYPSPKELIRDLECLLDGEAPRFARQGNRAGIIKGLTQAAPEEESLATIDQSGVALHWVIALAVLLGISLVFNVLLLIMR
jgi:serine/threonine-protein kinase